MKVLSFFAGSERFAVDVSYAMKIERNVDYTVIPTAPREIVGILNVKGYVVTLFNLLDLLGYEEGKKSLADRINCIVLKPLNGESNQIGFVIDKPDEIIEIDESDIQSPPIAESTSKKNIEQKGYSDVSTMVEDGGNGLTEKGYITRVASYRDSIYRIIDIEKMYNVNNKENVHENL